MKTREYIIRRPFPGYVQSTLTNGFVDYTGKEVRTETIREDGGKTIEIKFVDSLSFEQYNEQKGGGLEVVTEAQLDELFKDFEKGLQGEWQEISEERYFEMLEMLPPARWRKLDLGVEIFAISEALTGSLHAHFVKMSNRGTEKYFEAIRDIWANDRDLLKEIKQLWIL